jgi:hypothetical protein
VNELNQVASWLEATSPYGIVAVLGWAFWRINEKKDAALRELYAEVAALSRAQTEAVTKVESALLALKDAITELKPEAHAGRYSRPDN